MGIPFPSSVAFGASNVNILPVSNVTYRLKQREENAREEPGEGDSKNRCQPCYRGGNLKKEFECFPFFFPHLSSSFLISLFFLHVEFATRSFFM